MFCAVFWNIGGKSHRQGIVRLITALQRQEDADVIALAECSDGVIGSLLRGLNAPGRPPEYTIVPTQSRVKVLARQAIPEVREIEHHRYYSIFQLSRGKLPSLNLAVVHMVSLLEKDAAHIDREVEQFAEAIRKSEETISHDRTIVLGDLNAHPFSEGVAGSVGLHGVMSRRVASRTERPASHRLYPFFFNPMWQFFGDDATGPAGTYYRAGKGDHLAFYWHLFDQVLLRPSLLPFYQDDSVCIVTKIAGTNLAGRDGTPDRESGSDHFPIRVRVNC